WRQISVVSGQQPYDRDPSRSLPCGSIRCSSLLSALALGLAGRKRLHFVSGERIAANSPIATLIILDDKPRHVTHVLAFDRDHRIRELADHLLLLRLRENAFDQLNIDQRHTLFSC